MRTQRVLSMAAAALVWVCITMGAASAQDLQVSGNRFTVNGTPRFLVLVSYFDLMDVSDANIYRDFDHLRAWGVDGIRIFPNWYTRNPNTYAGDTLIDPNGHIRESTFWNMVWYLDRAREFGLLVDISFSAETVADLCDGYDCPAPLPPLPESNRVYASLTMEEALHGIREVALRLAGPNYRHVMFDVQNESNYIGPLWNPLCDADVASIVNAVKSVDPSRIVMASVEQSFDRWSAGQRANSTGQDVVAYHEPRETQWWDQTYHWVQELRYSSGKPIYLQEPERYRPGTNDGWLTAAGLQRAVEEAKRAGAAAWTFHTSAGYYMNHSAFVDQLEGPEFDFLSHFKSHLDNTYWGI